MINLVKPLVTFLYTEVRLGLIMPTYDVVFNTCHNWAFNFVSDAAHLGEFVHPLFTSHFYKGKVPSCFPRRHSPSKMGFTLKGKKLLLEEQIHSYKS